MRNLAVRGSIWQRFALAATLAITGVLTLEGGAGVSGAGPGPTPLAGAGVTVLSDTLVLASPAQVTVTFENQTGANLDATLWSTGLIDPAVIAPGTPAEGQLTAAGVDVTALAANSPNATSPGTTCSSPLAPGDRCTVSLQTAATIAPVGVSLRFADSGGVTVAEIVVVWPSLSFPAPSNDDWANAQDVSALAVPPFDGTFTGAGVAGTTVGATRESAEPIVDDGFGNPSPLGTVWYRYESPPGGFEGLLGFQVSEGFLVTAYAAYETDPFNPFLGLYPDEGPGALDRLAIAPQYTVRRDLPGGLFYGAPVVRVEPGQKVWFQVVPNPRAFGVSPGPFDFELYHVDDVAERVATAAPAYNCGVACGPLSTFSQIGYADTFAASPQAQGPAPSWLTFEVATRGSFAVTASSQKASRRESDRPLTVEVFRAPSSAGVADPAELGAPVASSTGVSVPVTTWLNGQWTVVPQWSTEVANLIVTPGRYYVKISGDPTFVSYWARLTEVVGTPPTATITSPPAGAAYAQPSDVPAFAYSCTAGSAPIASVLVLFDGITAAAGDPLPSTPGTHTALVECTDADGVVARVSSQYSVAFPLVAPGRTIVTPEDVAQSIDLVAPIVVPPGVTVTLESASQPTHGTVSAGSAGVTYTPAPEYSGPDSFTYTVVASNGQRATAGVSVTVLTVNDAPVAVDDALAVDARRSIEIDLAQLLANDTDVDGGALSVTSITRSGGTVTGQLTACAGQRPTCRLYIAPQSPGTELFDYTVSDGNGGTDTGRLTITVRPIALPDFFFLSMPCDNVSVSGPTTGIRIVQGFGVVLVRGFAQLGSIGATFRVSGFSSGGFAFGWVTVGGVSPSGRVLVPQSISNPIGDTWVITGTYRIGRRVCPFQINVRDGG